MTITDAHAHVGTCDVFGLDQSPADLLAAMDRYGIRTSLVQPFPGVWNPPKVHDQIAQMAADHPGRVYGIASMPPHGPPQAYLGEIRRCVEDLGFVGVKLHTIGHAVGPASPGAEAVVAAASDLGIPVLIHTGMGIPFADPGVWLPMIQRHPTVPFVLCHAGGGIVGGAALAVARTCDNVWLESSAAGSQDLRGMRRAIGAQRLLYGSDLIGAIPVELAKCHALALEAADEALVFGDVAVRLFGIGEAGADPMAGASH